MNFCGDSLDVVLQIIKSLIKLIVLILFFFQKLGESTELATLMYTRGVQKVLQLDHKEEWKCYKLHVSTSFFNSQNFFI